MTFDLTKRLQVAPIVPLIQANDPAVAIEIAKALVAGGLTVIEVVLRTDEAIECMRQVSLEVPDAIVGAGTVLSAKQAHAVADAGAAFIVSPGLDEGVVRVAQKASLPIFPGIATASELQRAWNLGLDAVKFFPAGQAGGTAMLKALGSVFRQVRFIPTGGISPTNIAEFLALPSVLACGGSWLTPSADIAAGNFDAITRLAEEALDIVNSVRNE
jgi:2-dehydro-3-deoxyphosphogluconate aldolase/(4S)-4-hydroxy-2-oxoglutarate aldolase